ncbi:MAG: hypothetical protein MUD02_06100 [Bacteroidales bacterium]|jgi:hypothetical protein|nr:hypothetical protein [Bacteroidales bacterium]
MKRLSAVDDGPLTEEACGGGGGGGGGAPAVVCDLRPGDISDKNAARRIFAEYRTYFAFIR